MWLGLTGEDNPEGFPYRAHRPALDRPRPVTHEYRRWVARVESIFDAVLERFENRYEAVFRNLDALLQVETPTLQDARALRNDVPNSLTARLYFFNRLQNPQWIAPMKEEGFFEHPPIEEIDDEGRVSFPAWPTSHYLARMARHPDPTVQATVLDAMRDIPSTTNPAVLQDFAEVAVSLPTELAKELVPRARAWIASRVEMTLVPDRIGTFISRLLASGEVDAALELTEALLALDPVGEPEHDANVKARIRSYNYAEFLKHHLADLINGCGLKAVELLARLLDRAVELSIAKSLRERNDDMSTVWRRTIGKKGRFHQQETKNLLVSAVRDASIQLITTSPELASQLLTSLESRRWPMFQRLALHITDCCHEVAGPLIADRLTNHALFNNYRLRTEYVSLLRNHFGRLGLEHQRVILSWIDTGPDLQRYRDRFPEWRGQPATDEDVERYKSEWQRDWLALIEPALNQEWLDRYRQLTEVFGPAERIDRPDTFQTWSGPTSPSTAEELQGLDDSQLLELLANWDPSGQPMSSTRKGLARELTSIVAANPERFVHLATRFTALDPTYVRGFVEGLGQAIKNKVKSGWEPVLDLACWVVAQAKMIPGRTGGDIDQDLDWGWTRRALARLLNLGFSKGEHELPLALRAKVWQILEPLTDDPDPTPEREAEGLAGHGGALNLGINTVRATAIDAVISYAAWVVRHTVPSDDAVATTRQGFVEAPDARKVLEHHLNPSHDPSLAVRAMYGQQFDLLTWLDRTWAASHIDAIFPMDSVLRDHRESAWQAYLLFGHGPNAATFELLEPHYRLDVEALGQMEAEVIESFIAHLMQLFIWELIELEGANSLLGRFFETASPQTRSMAITFMGRGLHPSEKVIDPKILDRFRTLWEHRIAAAQAMPEGTDHSELVPFGWWFSSGRFANNWMLDNLRLVLTLARSVEPDHQVLEGLANMAGNSPLASIQCLSLLIDDTIPDWNFHVYSDRVHTTLTAVLRSENPEAREVARAAISRLSARGYHQFRDLLGHSQPGTE